MDWPLPSLQGFQKARMLTLKARNPHRLITLPIPAPQFLSMLQLNGLHPLITVLQRQLHPRICNQRSQLSFVHYLAVAISHRPHFTKQAFGRRCELKGSRACRFVTCL